MHPFVYSENINRPEEAEERTSAEVRPKHSPQSFCNTFFFAPHTSAASNYEVGKNVLPLKRVCLMAATVRINAV